MKTTLKIYNHLKVGLQHKSDTYSKKLGYVTYYLNDKNKERNEYQKQKSFDGWRDHTIECLEFENVPTEGFVLNKRVGGDRYGWNPRDTYVRVYDPRGFEFEITVPNLLHILDNNSSIKGKGLEGTFVYSWDGTQIVLLSTDSADYEEIVNYNKKLHEPIKLKDLVVGHTYTDDKNINMVYLGMYDFNTRDHYYENQSYVYTPYYDIGKHHVFCDTDGKYYNIVKSKKLIGLHSTDVPDNFNNMVNNINHYGFTLGKCGNLRRASPSTKDELKRILNNIRSIRNQIYKAITNKWVSVSYDYNDYGKTRLKIGDEIIHTFDISYYSLTNNDLISIIDLLPPAKMTEIINDENTVIYRKYEE